MRAHYAVALAVVLGIGAGGSAMQVLRAQAKPPVYIVTEIAVSELSGYANEYAPRAQASILKAGGRILEKSFEGICSKDIRLSELLSRFGIAPSKSRRGAKDLTTTKSEKLAKNTQYFAPSPSRAYRSNSELASRRRIKASTLRSI